MDIDKLKKAGINYGDSLRRFANNETLYKKFLNKFLEDQTFLKLGEYLADKNYDEAFKCAHTLKGVSGNLSLIHFYENDCILVESLRNYQIENVQKQYECLLSSYKQVKEAITELM